jgi:hypothetical protein
MPQLITVNRIRQQIIDLDTKKVYLNETQAEKELNISRYYIHKSLEKRIIVMNKKFAYYSYGMDVENLKDFYERNLECKVTEKAIKKLRRKHERYNRGRSATQPESETQT